MKYIVSGFQENLDHLHQQICEIDEQQYQELLGDTILMVRVPYSQFPRARFQSYPYWLLAFVSTYSGKYSLLESTEGSLKTMMSSNSLSMFSEGD